MIDVIYNATVDMLIVVRLVLTMTIALIVIEGPYFNKRPKWRMGFLIGCAVSFVALAGDLMDGQSTLTKLHIWSLMRDLSVVVIFTSIIGMQWDRFAPILFNKSRIFNNPFMRKIFRYKGNSK